MSRVYISGAIAGHPDGNRGVLLPGWGRSRGASAEVAVAKAIGIHVYRLPGVSA